MGQQQPVHVVLTGARWLGCLTDLHVQLPARPRQVSPRGELPTAQGGSGQQNSRRRHLVAFRGLRRSEAVGLPCSDVDLDRRTVTIRETRVQVGADVIEGDTKTDSSARTVSLDAGTLEVLRTHRRRQAELRLLLGSAWIDTGLVFTKADGAALVPDSVSQRFDRLVIRTGLLPVRLHDLRHLAASLTYRATRDLELTSQLLGHAATAITEQVCTWVFEDVEREPPSSPRRSSRGPAERPLTLRSPLRAHLWALRAALQRTKPRVRPRGAGGARTHDPGIMSPML